jgi:hypothetical protein
MSEPRVQSRVTSCQIRRGRADIKADNFLQFFFVFPLPVIIPSLLHTPLSPPHYFRDMPEEAAHHHSPGIYIGSCFYDLKFYRPQSNKMKYLGKCTNCCVLSEYRMTFWRWVLSEELIPPEEISKIIWKPEGWLLASLIPGLARLIWPTRLILILSIFVAVLSSRLRQIMRRTHPVFDTIWNSS